MSGWVVARTHHNRELWACENIKRQGAEFYLARVLESTHRMSRRLSLGLAKPQYLFPGYVFVRPTNGQWRFLLGTYGVAAIIMSGSSPAYLPDRELQLLRSREGPDGIIRLPTKRLTKGNAVTVRGGLYAGYSGIYDGQGPQDRERVLLDYLGHKTKVLIAADQLEVA